MAEIQFRDYALSQDYMEVDFVESCPIPGFKWWLEDDQGYETEVSGSPAQYLKVFYKDDEAFSVGEIEWLKTYEIILWSDSEFSPRKGRFTAITMEAPTPDKAALNYIIWWRMRNGQR